MSVGVEPGRGGGGGGESQSGVGGGGGGGWGEMPVGHVYSLEELAFQLSNFYFMKSCE